MQGSRFFHGRLGRPGLRCVIGLIAASAAGLAQLSSSAYRGLGQLDLRQNGLNMVQGGELHGPNAVALAASEGLLHLYVADTRNHRVVGWQDARSFQNGEPPTLVLGQPTLQHVNPEGIGARGLFFPVSLAADPTTGNLYVADLGHNRVLRYPKPFANPTRVEPDAVYGQPSFTVFNPNSGGLSDRSLNQPRAVAFDFLGNLWVADSGNHRLLRFPAAVLEETNPSADVVIGQRDFISAGPNLGGLSAATLDTPSGVTFDRQNNLFVSDFNNARVLRFPFPQSTRQAASLVVGQTSFTVRGVPPQPTASSMAGPMGLSIDEGGNLHVAIPGDNRILIFALAGFASSAAREVLGQSNFTTNSPNSASFPRASANSLFTVADVKLDGEGRVYAADAGNNRVVMFASNSKSASRVLGQTDFSANGANQVKAGSINAAYEIAVDYSRAPFALYVSDTNNHRVLVWKDAVRFRTGAPADLVIGQPDLGTALPNSDSRSIDDPSRTSLRAPRGIVADRNGALYVADSGNHRVLRYARPVSQSGRITPDLVIGQTDFTTAVSAVVSASSLRDPSGLTIGPNANLFVSDSGNNRVLEFAALAGQGASAIRVYGQPTFTTGSLPTAASAQTLVNPQGLFVDGTLNLFVADFGANRVVVYPNTRDAPPSGASASIVIGQRSFDAAAPGSDATQLRSPIDVTLDSGGTIYVSDTGNNRVLVFPTLLFLPFSGAAATGVIGQPPGNLTSARANWNSPDRLATPEGLFAPAGLLFDRRDTLYVGDTGNNRVLHFLKRAAVVNAAHFQPSVPVARGAIVSLFSKTIAEATQEAASLPLPRDLSGREVLINDEIKAPLLFVSRDQVNLQLPASAPIGAQRISVRVAESEELLAGGGVVIASSSPGFFTTTVDGRGQAVILNQDGTINSAANPALRGSVIQLFGVGQGEVTPAVADGEGAPGAEPLARTVAVPTSDGATCLTQQPSVCVAIGSTFAEVTYSGLAPGFVGLWQVNVKIPDNSLAGAAVPLRAVINATPSNVVSVAIRN